MTRRRAFSLPRLGRFVSCALGVPVACLALAAAPAAADLPRSRTAAPTPASPMTPEPVEILRAPGSSCDLLTDGTYLYWLTSNLHPEPPRPKAKSDDKTGLYGRALNWDLTHGAVLRVALDAAPGTAPTRLATVEKDWWFGPSSDADNLYFSGERKGTLLRLPKTGGTPTVLYDLRKTLLTTLDDTYVYTSDRTDPMVGIWRVPKAGGAATLFVRASSVTIPRKVAKGRLYWAEKLGKSPFDDRWALKSVSQQGGDAKVHAELKGGLSGEFAADRERIYFVTGERLVSLSLDGGTLTELAPVDSYGDRGSLALDDTHVYVGNGKDGHLLRVKKTGGPPEVVVKGAEPCGVAIHGSAIFYMDRGGYRLMRLSK